MQIDLINVGSELLSGFRLNSHFQWIGKELREKNFDLRRQVTVPDIEERISQELLNSLEEADAIVITGGLGPTSDDITCGVVAKALQIQLIQDQKVIDWICDFLKKKNRMELLESQKKQAMIPCGAEIFKNKNGTAPGIYLSPRLSGNFKCGIFLLPGPSHEMQPLMREEVLPRLESFVKRKELRDSVSLKFAQITEPDFALSVEKELRKFPDLEYGFYPGVGELEFSLRGNPSSVEKISAFCQKIYSQECFSTKGESLAEIVSQLLRKKKWKISFAESCTAGKIVSTLGEVSGFSAILDCSWVAYSDASKSELLGVPKEVLRKYGAVSTETAEALSRGCLSRSQSDLALGVTGVAGPSGGTEKSPVGMVFFALSTPNKTWSEKVLFSTGSRKIIQRKAVMKGLDIIRRACLNS